MRLLSSLLLSLAALTSLLPLPALAQEKIGVLMLHGKSPGGPNDPNFGTLQTRLQKEGMLVLMPDMPWSRNRYIEGDWDKAMAEVDQHVKTLRQRGAARIVIAGHSMGCPAALGYAARNGTVDALVLLAPGHVPHYYYTSPRLEPVRKSIDEARALAASGVEDKKPFTDINQGQPQPVWMTPKSFLSYFDPASDAEMSVTAPRVPESIPVLWVIGKDDPLVRAGRGYVFDKLKPNPRHRYLEVQANHLSTPGVAADEVVKWIREAAAAAK